MSESLLNKTLNELGAKVVVRAKLELGTTRTIRGRKVRRVATDELRNSLYHRVFRNKSKYTIGFLAKGNPANYAMFVHEGVNGTKVNVGSQFTFKKQPPTEVIKEWMRVKKIRLRTKDGKFVKKTEQALNGAAFAIARGMKQNGVVGVPFFQLGIDNEIDKYLPKILDAYITDLDFNIL